MGQSIEEVLNRLVAVEDAAQQMQDAVDAQNNGTEKRHRKYQTSLPVNSGECVSAPQGAFGADWAETGDSSEHFGGKSALYGTGAGCDGTGGTEGARCDGAGA